MFTSRLLGGDIRGDVRYEDRVLNLQMLYVDDNFFQTFSFPLLHGDAATALKEINSVVLSEETALRLFNTTDAVGKVLPLDADPSAERLPDKAVVVTGVAKSLPAQSSIQFDALSRSMAWNGRLLVIGFASGTIPKLPVNLTLVKGYSVVGVFWGAFTQKEPEEYAANMRELLGWYVAGKVKPLIEGVYPLADAASVLNRVIGRGATGKLILKPEMA